MFPYHIETSQMICKLTEWFLYDGNKGYMPANMYLFKVNNRNTKKKCEICSNLTIKIPECCSSVFIVNFEHILHLLLVFLLLTLKK